MTRELTIIQDGDEVNACPSCTVGIVELALVPRDCVHLRGNNSADRHQKYLHAGSGLVSVNITAFDGELGVFSRICARETAS